MPTSSKPKKKKNEGEITAKAENNSTAVGKIDIGGDVNGEIHIIQPAPLREW